MIPAGEPLFPFYSNSKFGFFDRNFQIAIPPVYECGDVRDDGFSEFSEGFAMVSRTGWCCVFVSTDGRELGNDAWLQISNFKEGLAGVAVSDKYHMRDWGFIDTDGKMVIEPRFGFVEQFSCGLAKVTRSDREFRGYINRQGNFLVHEEFQSGDSFVSVMG